MSVLRDEASETRCTNLHGPTPPNYVHRFDRALREDFQCIFGNVGVSKFVDIAKQNACYIESDIPLADNDGLIACIKLRLEVARAGKTIIPRNKGPSRVYAVEMLARYAELLIS